MFLLVADVCIAEDEWTYITTGDHNVSFYINTSTLRVDSSKRKIWIMSDYEKGNITNPQMLSIKRQDEFDCKEEKYRSIYAVFYSGNMGSGDTVGSSGEGGITPIVPGSIGEYLSKAVCSLKKPMKK